MQRTGWGKSAVYFVATLLLRAAGRRPDGDRLPAAGADAQPDRRRRAGRHPRGHDQLHQHRVAGSRSTTQIRAGEVDVLLVSPERLNNPGFRDEVLPRLAATCGLLVVDEAHCISDWGHDFRPDYRRIRTLLGDLPDGIPVLATTATANARVTDDVAEQLGTDVLVLRGSLDRESLRLGVVRLKTAEQRLAWLADHLAEQPGVGIVYCLTVAATQEIADYLRSRGHDVAAYSGQTETTERTALEQDLADGPGQGADRDQRARAWASTRPSASWSTWGRRSRRSPTTSRSAAPAAAPTRPPWCCCRRSRTATSGPTSPRWPSRARSWSGRRSTCWPTRATLGTPALETRVELSRNRLETMLKVLDVDGAVRRVRGGWEATGQPWAYDDERYQRVREAREREQQAMLDYLDTDRLPDAVPARAARRPRGGRLRPLRQLRRPRASTRRSPTEAVEEADARLARPGVPIEPRKMWPTALADLGIDLKGKIAEPAEEGRAVARLTDLGHGQALRALFRPDTADGQVPVPLVQAVLTLLDDWRPEVDAIVVVESTTRPTLTDDLADGLSRRLQVPVVGRWAIVDPDVAPGQGAANSAQRVAAVGRRFVLAGRRARRAPGCCSSTTRSSPAGPSPWRPGRSGAPAPSAVLPLTLAIQS